MAKLCRPRHRFEQRSRPSSSRGRAKSIQLQAFGMQPLLPQTIVDGTIMDQGAVADAIRQLWAGSSSATKDVAIAIAGHSVIIKKIAVPLMTPEELRRATSATRPSTTSRSARRRRDRLPRHNPTNASGQTELLLVAAKKEVVVRLRAGRARREPARRRSSTSPRSRARTASRRTTRSTPRETVVLINIGAAISNINIVRSGVSLFTRDVTIGGNAFTEEIQKHSASPPTRPRPTRSCGRRHRRRVPQEVEAVMEGVSEAMAGEFQRSLDFFLATTADANVTRIVPGGGSAKVAALQRILAERARVPVEIMDPFRRSDHRRDAFDMDFLRAARGRGGRGVGLALRRPGDKRMIRINLLPGKKSKRARGRHSGTWCTWASACSSRSARWCSSTCSVGHGGRGAPRERRRCRPTSTAMKTELGDYDKIKAQREELAQAAEDDPGAAVGAHRSACS